LLVTGDVRSALRGTLEIDGGWGSDAGAGAAPSLDELAQRPDARALLTFALSDDFFALRERLGLAPGAEERA
jgi:hypothetical protein